MPEFVMAHVGTAAIQVRVRPLSEHTARLTLPVALPLRAGDRLVLRDPGQQRVLAGAEILDVDPPELRRRGAARRRGAELETADAALDPLAEVTRRGWMRVDELAALGATPAQLDALPAAVTRHGALLISAAQAESWAAALHTAVAVAVDADPLQARTPLAAAAQAAGLPDRGLVAALADAAGITVADGHASIPGRAPSLGAAEAGLQEALRRLEAQPFLAPERDDLAAWGLGPRQLAAAVRTGRLVDLGDQIVLAPRAPALAMRELAQLSQPFTTSEARQALGTTRRVVIPLLEELDRRGWTRRIDAGHREVARPKESR